MSSPSNETLIEQISNNYFEDIISKLLIENRNKRVEKISIVSQSMLINVQKMNFFHFIFPLILKYRH